MARCATRQASTSAAEASLLPASLRCAVPCQRLDAGARNPQEKAIEFVVGVAMLESSNHIARNLFSASKEPRPRDRPHR